MIIDKLVFTESEKQELTQVLETYQALIEEASKTGNAEKALQYFDEAGKQQAEIKKNAQQRYILSFSGRKAAVLDDVKEILAAATKEEFEERQDRRRAAIHSDKEIEEALPHLFNFESEQSKNEAIRIMKSATKAEYTLSEKNYNTFITFLFEILSLQVQVTFYHFEEPYNQKEQEEIQNEFSRLVKEKAKSCYLEFPIRGIPDFEEQFIKYSNIGFNTIRQGIATNTLTKIKPNTKRNTTIDPITGTATVTHENFTITIPNFTKLANLKTSTYQLLDALTVKLTETGAKSPIVTLSLEEYMKKRKIKDKKEAREQAKADLEILFNAQISFKEKRKKGKAQDFHDIRIIDGKGIKNGIMTVSFGTAFYNILLGYPVMPYPAQLFTLNSKRNPNSFYLLKKITEHKNMNVGKKNEDIIAVKTLLSIAPDIPSYDEVMKADRHIDQRIIKPFERDMDALSDTIKWTYCHSNNTPLTDEELKSLDYSVFITLLIKTEWNEYPDQTARLERKAERQEQAKQKKKKTTAKAT